MRASRYSTPTTPAPAKRGRKPDASSKSGKIRALLASGMSTADIAKKVGCTPALVYNVKAKAGGAKKRGPGRPAKTKGTRKAAASISSASGIEGILAAVKGRAGAGEDARGLGKDPGGVGGRAGEVVAR